MPGPRSGNAPAWAVGPGMQLEIFRAPALISIYPSLGALGGGGVVWARSADLVVEGGLSLGGFSCDFGGMQGTFAMSASSALGVCEAPPATSASIVRYARGDLGALLTPVGPGEYCSPRHRHPTYFEPSYLGLNGAL